MSARFEIPGAAAIELKHLVLDVNGTLTDHGELISGVAERIAPLRQRIAIYLLSADTRGQLDAVAELLALPAAAIARGEEKRAFVETLGADRCAAIGNGLNDSPMLRAARIGIAILGPEGASSAALAAADVVCTSITAALGLLDDPPSLASTVRP
ncbi:MAG: HAD family hydrolase [Actinobacteria bacterium]|nr:HAD family hydrolase [Actinomycetota bacterium]